MSGAGVGGHARMPTRRGVGKKITTLEGLGQKGTKLAAHGWQQATAEMRTCRTAGLLPRAAMI